MGFIVEDRRRHQRITAPSLTLQLDDLLYRTQDWSMGGFMLEGYRGRLGPGALFIIPRIVTFEGALAEVKARARVVRTELERQRLVVAFLSLDPIAYAILGDHMAARRRFLKDQQPV